MPPYYFLATKSEEQEEKTYAMIRDRCMSSGAQLLYEQIHQLAAEKFKFRFGTQDALLSLNDSLAKMDNLLEGVLRKVEKQIHDYGGTGDLRVETLSGKLAVGKYLLTFKWDDHLFSRSKSLMEICALIKEKMNENESEIRKMNQVFSDTKNQLAAVTKKDGGNFATRDIADVIYEKKIGKEHFIDTEHFTTLVAVVNKKQYVDWATNYELLDKGVVPRSSENLNIEDKDGYQLHTVVLFKNVVDTFVHEAKMKKFIIKRFTFNPEKYREEQEEKIRLEQRIKTLEATNLKSLDTIFGALFIALVHLKVIRIFIDAVLRFGVPPKFCSVIFKPKAGKEGKIMNALMDKFGDPKLKGLYGSKEEIEDQEDFYPFVLIPLGVPSESQQ